MKYKYSRKLLAKAYGGYDYEKDFLEDLLATKPEKPCYTCESSPCVCGEIEEVDFAMYQGNRDTAIEIMIENKLNEIIRTVNKLKQK